MEEQRDNGGGWGRDNGGRVRGTMEGVRDDHGEGEWHDGGGGWIGSENGGGEGREREENGKRISCFLSN